MTLAYKVVRSARRSVCINISADNEITVRCPVGYPQRKIEELFNRKSGWITRHISLNNQRQAINEDFTAYKFILVKGEKVPLVLGQSDGISPTGVSVKSLKNIKKLYCNAFSSEFLSRVDYISERTGLKAASVKFNSYTARWGCCDGKNNVVFNYKLFMLNTGLWDYVIIHELCHTRYHNHSKNFWALVESFLPDYKKRRKRLKSFGFITSLY